MKLRRCRKCGETKEDSNEFFHAYKGLRSSPCKVCRYKSSRTYILKNPEKKVVYHKKYRETNRERVTEAQRKYFKNNPESCKASARKYRKKYPEWSNERVRRRQAAKLQRTPSWLTQEHIDEMVGFYAQAKKLTRETGVNHEVDHIYPLQGKDCSGLHVPWNLQVLTKQQNTTKNNRTPIYDDKQA